MKRKTKITGLDKHGRKWRWRRTVNGRPVRVVFEAQSREDAIAKVLEFEKKPHIFISDSWEHELELHLRHITHTKQLSKHYASVRRLILTKAATDMRIHTPSQLSRAKIEKWLESVLDSTGKAGTRNTYLIHMRQFIKWLVAQKKLYTNPAEDIDQLHVEFKPRNTFVTSTEVREIIDAAKATGDKELVLILLLGFECGMRHGEISAAKSSWVSMTHNTITIPATEDDSTWSRKGRAGRRKEVVIEMVSELRHWFTENGIPSPFLLKPDQPWGKYKYRYDFKKKYLNHMKKCGHPDLSIHDMRRSFGSNRVIAGRSIEQVAHWMGIHPNTAWKYYARFSPNTGEIEHGSAASVAATTKQTPDDLTSIHVFETLSKLLKSGYITQQEYEQKRLKLLDNI